MEGNVILELELEKEKARGFSKVLKSEFVHQTKQITDWPFARRRGAYSALFSTIS